MLVQLVASVDTWIWNALPYAASQLSTTWQMLYVAPRSTCIHCGSENALDHRVPVLPSTARFGPVPAFSLPELVAVLLSATFVVPQDPPPPEFTVQVKDVAPEALVVSFAVTVTLEVPAAVGVPEMTPVDALMLSPAGSPLAL